MKKFILFVSLFFITFSAIADDRVIEHSDFPTTASDELSAAAESFTEFMMGLAETKDPFEFQKDLDPFWRDMKLTANIRSMYLNRTGRGPDNDGARETWAVGGSLGLHSGMYNEFFDFSVEGFTSNKLYGPEDKDGGLLLKPGQRSFTVLGVANARFHALNHVATLYRQRLNMPYLNQQDNRMVPNTFEAYLIGMPQKNNDKLQWGAGYVDKIKKRDASNFVTMSEAIGATNSQGMWFAGVRYEIFEDFKLAALEHYIQDVINVAYFEADYSGTFLGEDGTYRFNLQHLRQQSVGDELITSNPSFSTHQWGGQASASYKDLLLRLSLTGNSEGANLLSPYGSYLGYTGSTVLDFNRAGETTWRPSLSYDLKRIGIPGIKINAAYARASGAVDQTTGADIPDNRETDVTIDLRPPEEYANEWWRKLWLRLRSAYVQEEGNDSYEEYRVILNYDLEFPR